MNIKFIISGRGTDYIVCIIQSSILSRLVDEIQYPGNLFRVKSDCFIGIGKVEEMMKSGRKVSPAAVPTPRMAATTLAPSATTAAAQQGDKVDKLIQILKKKGIEFTREDYALNGDVPTLRRITSSSGVPTKQLYKLFPKKPAKKVAYVSGLHKPSGCL